MPSFHPSLHFCISRRGFFLVILLTVSLPGLAQQPSQPLIDSQNSPDPQMAVSESRLLANSLGPNTQSTKPEKSKLSIPSPQRKSPKIAPANQPAKSASMPARLSSFIYQFKTYLILVFLLALSAWLSVLSWWIRSQVLSLKASTQVLESKYIKINSSFTGLSDLSQSISSDSIEINRAIASHRASTKKNLDSLSNRLANLENQISSHQKHLSLDPFGKLSYESPSSFGNNSPDLPLSHGSVVSSHDQPEFYFSEPAPKSDPAQELVSFFQDAFYRNDRSALRTLNPEELIITEETENNLVRRTANIVIQLQVVNGGGSYLLIHKGGSHWLVPTFQTLSSFTSSQPAKGIFTFQAEPVSRAELRRPAEMKEAGGLWQIISMGLVAIPA